ncbi:MAG: DNA-directed RNA polymerase subunit N [Candidatus Micrarchaeia archaeon]|jgi:DNA-directed RNA polymerase subunit N
MYFPIRCFTCGAPIAHLWEDYKARVKSGESPAKVLDDLGVERMCCRRMFISHVEVMDKVIKYNKL